MTLMIQMSEKCTRKSRTSTKCQISTSHQQEDLDNRWRLLGLKRLICPNKMSIELIKAIMESIMSLACPRLTVSNQRKENCHMKSMRKVQRSFLLKYKIPKFLSIKCKRAPKRPESLAVKTLECLLRRSELPRMLLCIDQEFARDQLLASLLSSLASFAGWFH